MNETIIVSVFMITYNHEKFLSKALDSVLMQKTTFPFEIVIGEDCSTDGTRAILKEYELKYPNIIFPIYHENNVGAMRNAYEFTLPKCKGKYISCLEGDDYWTDPLKLQIQVDILEANEEFSLCFHNAELLYENQKTKERQLFREYDKSVYSAKENINKWIIPTASVVFRNVMIDRKMPAYFDNVVHGDFALFMWLGDFGKFYCINEVKSVYRRHDTSLMTQLNNINSIDRLIIQYKNMRDFFGVKYEKDFNKRISSYYLQNSLYYIQNRQYFKMYKSIFIALSYDFIVFFRKTDSADYLKYTSFKIIFNSYLLTLYKGQTFIRRSKLKSLFK